MPGAKGRSGGHNRKTTAQLEQEGTIRNDRHGKRVDAKVPPATLPCPGELTEVGQELWRRIVSTLPREVVTNLDSDALLSYCRVWQTLAKVWPQFDADPIDKDLRITAMNLLDRLDKLGRQFGWTPQSRAALQMPDGDGDDADPMLEFLKRKRERSTN